MNTVETLKSNGQYAEAGAKAFTTGRDRYYGCHYGMRSGRDAAMTAFYAAYDAAAAAAANKTQGK